MTKLKTMMLAVCLMATTGAIALVDMCERCWEVGGGPVYLKPYGKCYTFGADCRADGTDVRDLAVKPDYDWGFRIYGSTYTHDCCHLFWVDWTYLRTTDAMKTGGENIVIFPFQGAVANDPVANASLKFRYNKVNVRAGRYTSAHCNSRFYTFGGLGYLDLQRRQTAKVSNPMGTTVKATEKAQFEGASIQVGGGAEIAEPCNFHIVGHVAGVLGVGQRRLKHTLTSTETVEFRHPTQTTYITGLELRLGVEWRYECDCMWISAQFGWEMDQYFDAVRLMSGTYPLQSGVDSSIGTVPATSLHSIGFAGPYFHVAVRF